MRPALAESWDVSPDRLTWTFHLRRGRHVPRRQPVRPPPTSCTPTAGSSTRSWPTSDKLSAVTDVRARRRADRRPPPQTANAEPADQSGRVQGHGDRAAQERRKRPDRHPPDRHRAVRVRQLRRAATRSCSRPTRPTGAARRRSPASTFRFISEPSTALSALQAGEIEWTDSIPPQRVTQLRDDDSVELAVTPSNDYWYLALNEARTPWNDVRVRQAIAYAIDREAIVPATSYGTAAPNQTGDPRGQLLVHRLRADTARHRAGQAPAARRPARRTPNHGHAGHQRVPRDGHRGPGHRRQPRAAWHHGQHPHRRLRHLARPSRTAATSTCS